MILVKKIHPGVVAGIGSAVLFGAGTPLAKLLLDHASPWLLAGLLYFGSGLGLCLWRILTGAHQEPLQRAEWRWLAAAVLAGGLAGPALLMLGLSAMPASGASLLLNAEGVLTALIALFVFKENFDWRIAAGMVAIVSGTLVQSWPTEGVDGLAGVWPALAVLGACLAWAIDNNLTRKVSTADASFIAMMKGLVAGSANLTLAFVTGAIWPSAHVVAGAMLLGLLSYGASLVLFVIA